MSVSTAIRDPNSRNITVASIPGCGRGVVATRAIAVGEYVEIAPVIVIGDDFKALEDATLGNYAFRWGLHGESACIALGYVSLYNHSYAPNATLQWFIEKKEIGILVIRAIKEGEEITINYNGRADDTSELWFEVAP